MIKYKFLTKLFVTLFLAILSITTIKAQSSCPVFIPKPATFVSANKAATVGSMSYVLDGEGTTGLPSSGQGNVVYWLQSVNPVTFYFDMKASSTISRVKFYQPWGFDEGAQHVTVRLYNGATLLGTEAIVLPSFYPAGYIAILSKTYTNVTKIQIVIVDDYNISGATPKRTSLKEVVFGDTACIDTDGDTVSDYLDFDNDNDGIKDIDENCSGFLAQNTSGAWKGKTVSNLTATLTGATAQANTHTFSDGQIRYYVNQNGGDPRYYKAGTASFTYTFSTPVPANEIAFFVDDIDPSLGSTNASINFKINGGDPNGNFVIANYSTNTATYLNYNPITGVMSTSSSLDDQRLIIKGVGDILVSSITITNSGIPTGDGVAYALLANHPCDIDGDGIANIYDLDSDNDGCPDAIEGGGNFNNSSLVNSTMPGGNSGATSGTYNLPVIQNLGNTVGNTTTTLGIPTIAGTGQSFGYSDNADVKMCLDSDADGVPDVCDLDDDNDGILDVNENNCSGSGTTPNVRIGYIPNSRDLDGDNGYTFNGGYMSGSGALKLTNTANFGSTGTVNANITLIPITANPITKADITNLNLNAIFLGGIDNTASSYLSDAELAAIKDWSDDKASNFVVVTQFQSKAWSSTITSGNVNPDKPTDFGKGTSIFNGPFGIISTFNQGGGYQAYFGTLNGACSTKNIAVDNNGRTVMYVDGIYNDLIIADVDILTTFGGVTSGSAITSNNDKLFANIWAFVVNQSSCSDIDTDGDGIPNRLDLDSDGDGCVDAIEGAGNFTSSQLTTAFGTINAQSPDQNFGTSVDIDGIPNIVGTSGQTIGQSQDATKNDCIDSDGDGVSDWQDLDDDNDGILDCDEKGLGATAQINQSFELNGTSTMINANEVRLTNNTTNQAGQIWSNGKVDFTKSFTLNYEAYLGTTDLGADGIASVFHNDPAGVNAIGANGDGLGARGIKNGIVLELDTYTNTADPGSPSGPDHGQIWKSSDQSAISTPIALSNLENGAWHPVVVSWNAGSQILTYTVDGVTVGTYIGDIVSNYFGGATKVYFGFTASTGLLYNEQKIKFTNFCSDLPLELDTDSDGIPNHLDLDSDNDGCLDAIEGAGNFTGSQLTTASGTLNTQNPNQNFGTVVDANGVPTIVGAAGQGIGESQDLAKNDCIDSDRDGVPDWLDLDDDNDGILDTNECISNNRITNGIFPTSGTLSTPWSTSGTYFLTSRGLVFQTDAGAVATVSQNVTGIFGGSQILLNNINWLTTAITGTSTALMTEILYNGTVYTTINTGTGGAGSIPSIVGKNGATTNISYLPAIASDNIWSTTNSNLIIILPQNLPSSIGTFQIKFTSGSSSNAVDDIAIGSVAFNSCSDSDGDGILNSLDLDSDNDGCPDAIEGGANFTYSNLVDSSMPGGNNGTTSGTYNLPVIKNLGNTVGNTPTTMGVPTIAGTGQSIGDSQNFAANSQCTVSFCYKPATTTGTTLDTNHGITALGRAGADNGNWPMVRKGAWTVLEAKTKGFVVNRLTDTQISAIPASNLVEGMLVYNITQDCLQINIDGTATGWKCFNTQSCPD